MHHQPPSPPPTDELSAEINTSTAPQPSQPPENPILSRSFSSGDTHDQDRMQQPPLHHSHLTISRTTSSQYLCERCSASNVGNAVEKLGRATLGKFAEILQSSLEHYCKLCLQFKEILRIAALEAGSVTTPAFDLSRNAFEILSDRGMYQGQYLTIHFKRSSRQIHLFPMHRLFTRFDPRQMARIAHVYPLDKLIEPERPDFEEIRSLLQKCRERHGITCKPCPPPINILRVIDCSARKIVPAQ